MNILDTPQEMAKYMTDNAILQEYLLQMLQIADEKQNQTWLLLLPMYLFVPVYF